MSTEAFLLNYGKISSYISIVASVLFIISTNESLEIEAFKAKDETPPEFKPTPAEVSTLAFFIAIFNNIINYQIAILRYEQLKNDKQQGDSKIDLNPNIKFIVASTLALIAAAIAFIAAKEKLASDVQVIIAR